MWGPSSGKNVCAFEKKERGRVKRHSGSFSSSISPQVNSSRNTFITSRSNQRFVSSFKSGMTCGTKQWSRIRKKTKIKGVLVLLANCVSSYALGVQTKQRVFECFPWRPFVRGNVQFKNDKADRRTIITVLLMEEWKKSCTSGCSRVSYITGSARFINSMLTMFC